MIGAARPNRAHRLVGALVALGVIASLTACQAGQTAQTSQAYNPVDGRNVNVPEDTSNGLYIGVRNAVMVAGGGNGSLVVTLVNHSGELDVLESARVGDQEMEFSETPVDLEPGTSVDIGFDADYAITVTELAAQAGDWVDLELAFANAGIADFQVLVVPYGDEYVSDDSEAPLEVPEAEGAE